MGPKLHIWMPGCKLLIAAVKQNILTSGSMWTDLLLEPTSRNFFLELASFFRPGGFFLGRTFSVK